MKIVVSDPTGEEDMQAALALRETASNGKLLLKVPSLWLYEVGNTLVRRHVLRCGLSRLGSE